MKKKEVEAAITNHAEWIEHLAGRMDELAAAQTKTEAQIAETNRALKESGEATDRRIREVNDRVDKLVSSIGDLIRRIPPENLRGNGQESGKK